MSNTPKQNKRERFARFMDGMFGKNEESRRLRETNRKVEKRKRNQFRKR